MASTASTTGLVSPHEQPGGDQKRRRSRAREFDPIMRTPTSDMDFRADSPDSKENQVWLTWLRTPLAFASFLFSLAYVDYRARSRRTSASDGSSGGYWYLPNLPSLGLWSPAPPEPVQDPGTSAWDAQSGTKGAAASADSPGYVRKKLRRVVSMEINDAFDNRPMIATVLILLVVSVVTAMWFVVRWAWQRIG